MDSFRLVTTIRRLHHAVRAQIVEDVRAQGFEDIAAPHIYVFQTPGPEGLRPGELARRTLTSKQAMNHLLGGLEERGYIERSASSHDARARVVRLTKKGRRLTEAVQQSAAAIEGRWSAALGAKRLSDLHRTLEALEATGVSAQERWATTPRRGRRSTTTPGGP
jgi:DNA-binding MarR family transcriptional regulator